jgi:hypothetical protein
MTEQEWLDGIDPQPMLDFLHGRASDRKLRFFACACCRRIDHLIQENRLRRVVETSEQYGDGLALRPQLVAAFEAALDLPFPGRQDYRPVPGGFIHCDPFRDVDWTGLSLTGHIDEVFEHIDEIHHHSAVEAALWATFLVWKENWDAGTALATHQAEHAAREAVSAIERTVGWLERREKEKVAQAELMRQIFGNPFRPYPAPPSWSAPVVKLAEALYAGEDCAFALRDALLEAGHPELAEHFRDKDYQKGCWALDLLLGKE